jgi:DNA polymerase-3 subunit gamma/tau
MCASENVKVDEGVLSLVVRSGGGSVRDSLSLLDQLIAGSENNHVTYERAVGLLGYTDSALLDSVIDAFAIGDAAEVFASVDRVIQSGQDPHRFVEDLLERVRDLIVVGSVGLAAKNVLRDIPADQLERMRLQVERFGKAELTYAAQVISEGLTRMNGATSPKLQLELMVSKVLVPAQDSSETGSLARIERLERRMGLGGNAPTNSAPLAAQFAATPVTVQAEAAGGVPAVSWDVMQSSWGDVMTKLASISRSAWQVILPQTPIGFDGSVLDIRFANDHDMKVFKDGGTNSPSEILRKAIFEVLGVRVKYRAVTANTGEPVVQVSIPKQEPVSIKKQEPVALVTEPIAKVEEKIEEVNQNRNKLIDEDAQMGDSVLRNVLGAEPIEDS